MFGIRTKIQKGIEPDPEISFKSPKYPDQQQAFFYYLHNPGELGPAD
jgi:hypothetical protein